MTRFNLDNDPKMTPGFKIPDGYFEDLQAKIIQQLPEKEIEVISFPKNRNWIYVVAAVLVVALTIPVYHILKPPAINPDKAAMENYIASNSAISDEDFAELLDEKDINQIKIDLPIEDKAIEDFLSTNSNLEEYITN